MGATEKMRSVVKEISRQADQAEEKYLAKKKEIERMTGRTMDFYSTSFRKDLSEIVRGIGQAADEAYATCQALVIRLDEQCRPLLDQNPTPEAVREVVQLLQRLNELSTFDISFNGTLNGNRMGQIADVDYKPAMACQMAQKYWESTYQSMPDVQEAEQKVRQEERRKQEGIAKKQEEAGRKEIERKKQEAQAIRNQAPAELEKERRFVEEKFGLEKKRRAFMDLQDKLQKENENLTGEKEKLQAEQESLGFFQMGDRIRIRKRLKEIDEKILGNDRHLETERDALAEVCNVAEQALKWREKAVHIFMEKYPEQWRLYEVDLRPILEFMEEHGRVTITQIHDNHPRNDSLSSQTILKYFCQETFHPFYRREVEDNGITYFSLNVSD